MRRMGERMSKNEYGQYLLRLTAEPETPGPPAESRGQRVSVTLFRPRGASVSKPLARVTW